MFAALATRLWHRHHRFDTPLVSALEGQQAAVHGDNQVLDKVARSLLGIRNPRAGYWREAASTALMSDWVPLIHEENASLLVPQHLKRETDTVNKRLQPLWERKVNGRRVDLLDSPTAEGLTVGDLAASTAEPDQEYLRTSIDEPRVRSVLAALDPDEREVALAYARNPTVRTWTEAAEAVGRAQPEQFGERVRRKLKRLGAKQTSAARR
ncbi:hypothetical protein [Streptomyces luteogriseus]|uniref:hypothetical protein n=1 Tax=Streptomyces luteogriseus TaxID=68233 RepID=UPI00380848C6